MTVDLPDDILYLICDELRRREDWATLFSLGTSCTSLAPLALSELYRIQKSPGSDEEAEGQFYEANLLVQRWSIYWRSICLASKGKTMFPYHQYLRVLDLRDLKYLLEDPKFAGPVSKKFFSGELAQFDRQVKRTSRRGNRYILFDIPSIINDIADEIVSGTHNLEQVSGELSGGALLRWVRRIPRLKTLELYNGDALAQTEVHEVLYEHCPHFQALSIYQWTGSESDQQLGSFVLGLPNHTLTDFTTISSCGIAFETCRALNNHGKTLKRLRLNFASSSIPALALLQECTNVEDLHLEIPTSIDMAASHNEVLEALVSWLTKCVKLKEITLTEFKCAPTILTPLLLSDKIHLKELTLNCTRNPYSIKDNRDFHFALASQKSLETLNLRGDTQGMERIDVDLIVESVKQLVNLKSLKLRGLADYFEDDDVIRCLTSLTALEEVHFALWTVTNIDYGLISDAVLPTLASLPKLYAITFGGPTQFTCNGLLDFVERLEDGRRIGYIAIDNAEEGFTMNEEQVELVRATLRMKAGARFEYVPIRDPAELEFDESDSD